MYLQAIFCLLVSCNVINVLADQCTLAQVCVTDLKEEDCDPGTTLVPQSTIFGCCPGCEPSSGATQPDPTKCSAPSNCLPDGRYAPVQCKGDRFTGRCFCSDENGNRIFGQMWRDQADEMTCACSRTRAELEARGREDVGLHCTAGGDYEPLQCDGGLCWCVQASTGQPTVPPVLQADMERLPCYTAAAVGEQYLRRCESLVNALATIRAEQLQHGTNFLGNPVTFCDYDGSYGAYQIQNGIAYCTGRDGSILGSWQALSSEMSGMNCNCARDSTVYFPEKGMSVTAVCQGNGNYQPNQNIGDVYYCVDTDGYPTTDYMDAWPSDNCASFS